MGIRIKIDGVGVVELGDEFLQLSPEEQNATIDEIAKSHGGADENTDWIGQTVGGTGGAIAGAAAGAYAGTFLAPFTFGLSIPIGAVLGGIIGGAAGGAGGEYIEKKIENDWDALTPDQQAEVIAAGVEEGIWGAIPGGVGSAAKGARVLTKVNQKQSTAFLKAAIARVTGKGVAGQAANVAADIIIDASVVGKLAKWGSKLSDKQKRKIIGPLIDGFIKSLPANATLKAGIKEDMIKFGYGGAEALEKLFARMAGTKAGQDAIRKWALSDVAKKAGIASVLTVLKGAGKAYSEVEYENRGGLIAL